MSLTLRQFRIYMKAATLSAYREAVSNSHMAYLSANLTRAKKLPKINRITPKPPSMLRKPKVSTPQALSSSLRAVAMGLGVDPEEYNRKARKL